MLGYTSEQLLKSKLHDLMPEPLAQLHQRYIKGRGELLLLQLLLLLLLLGGACRLLAGRHTLQGSEMPQMALRYRPSQLHATATHPIPLACFQICRAARGSNAAAGVWWSSRRTAASWCLH